VSVVRDISQRKGLEKELVEHKELLSLFIQYSPASLAMFDKEMRYIATSQNWVNDHTGGVEQLVGKKHYEVFPDIPRRWKDIHQYCLQGNIEKCEEDIFTRANGTVDWIRWEVHPWHKPDGSIGGLIIFTEVITQRKKATELFKRQFENSPDIILIIDKEFRIESINRGYPGGEHAKTLIGVNSIDILPEESQALAKAAIIQCFETGKNQEIECRMRYGNWARSRFVPINYADGTVSHLMIIATDITEQKKAEESIRQSEANYRQIFEHSPAPMWLVSEATNRVIRGNQACLHHYGYAPSEFEGMNLENIILQPEKTNVLQNFIAGERHVKKSGEVIDVVCSSIPVIIDGEKQILIVSIDVTERNQYEQKLARAAIKMQEEERYEIGGELHDNVCQILTASQLSLSMIKKSLTPEAAEFFNQGNQYISLASKEIRNLSHRLAPAFFDEATMEDAFRGLLYGFNVAKKYKVKLSFDCNSRNFPIDRDLQLNLYRILQEQLKNILKYANASTIEVNFSIKNKILRMKIGDDGVGFDMGKIKEGIGLANMNRRVRLFSGNFTIESSTGKGCEILVEIPLH